MSAITSDHALPDLPAEPKVNKFKMAGRQVVQARAMEYGQQMKTATAAMKDSKIILEGPLGFFKPGRFFAKGKFVRRWVRLTHDSRVCVEYFDKEVEPAEGDSFKDCFKLDPPGVLDRNTIKKDVMKSSKNTFVFQIKVSGRDQVVAAFECSSLEEQNMWEKCITDEVIAWKNELVGNRNSGMGMSIRKFSVDGPAPGRSMQNSNHDEFDDDFTDDGTEYTETDATSVTDTGTKMSLSNIGSEDILNINHDDMKLESKQDLHEDEIAAGPSVRKSVLDSKGATKRYDPHKIPVSTFEDRLTDAGLAQSKQGIDALVQEAMAMCDPSNSGYVTRTELERFILQKHAEIDRLKLTCRVQPLEKTDTTVTLRGSLTKHVDGVHFEDHGISWDSTHASANAEVTDRERIALGIKRATLLSTAVGPSTLSSVMDLKNGERANFTEEDEDDWNKMYQTALEMPEKNYADAVAKGLVVHRLQRKLIKVANLAARTIVDEFPLPNTLKSIPPLEDITSLHADEDSEESELTYVYRNLLVRLNVQDEEVMHKIAGNEMRSMRMMQEASTKAYQKSLAARGYDPNTKMLGLILSFLVDYNGFRFFVMSMPPIDEERTQVYGRQNTHDPNSEFLDKDATFHGLYASACAELNLKPHFIISKGDSLKITGSVETQGHCCEDGRYYAINFARMLPSDLPNDGIELLTKQLRPELVQSFRMPLSSDAFSHLTLPPKDEASAELLGDADQSDVEVGSATRYMLKDRLPSFVHELDRLKTFPYDSGTFTKAVHDNGINIRHTGRIAEQTRLPHVRELAVVEMLARTGKVILGRGHRRIISKAQVAARQVLRQKATLTGTKKIDSDLKANMLMYAERLRDDTVEHIVDFFNLMVGSPNDKENDAFWNDVLIPCLSEKFGYHHLAPSDPLRIDRRHICPMQLFHALQYHCSVRCAASDHYDFDREAFPVSVDNVISVEPSCKYIKNNALDLNTVATMAEVEREKKRYLVALQGFRMRLFVLNNTTDLGSDLESARTYNQIADMYVLDFLEGFSREQHAQETNSAIATTSAATPAAALNLALEYSEKALSLTPSTHALASRIHETRMKIFFHMNEQQKMMREFVAGMRSAVAHFGKSGNHPFVCELHCVLGALFKKMNRIPAAKVHLTQAKELALKILGGTHTLVASYATQLAHVFSSSGSVDHAIVHHQQALLIHETAMGANSLECANNAFYLAECYAEQGDMPKAAEFARRALSIREECMKEKTIEVDDDNLLSSYYQMASMCVTNAEHGHAAHYYELVLAGLRNTKLQTDLVLREIQRVTRDILNLKILTLSPIVMRRLQAVVNKHRPDKLLLAIAGSDKGSMELMETLKAVIEQISADSPSQYIDRLVEEAGLLNPNSTDDAGSLDRIDMAEKSLSCIIALTEQNGGMNNKF